MAIARKFWASHFNFDWHVYPENDVFCHLYHKLGNEKNPINVKVGGACLCTALMCRTYPWIWTYVKGKFYSIVWRLNHLQIMRMTTYTVLYLFPFCYPWKRGNCSFARQQHKKFNVSYETTINLVYNLRKQNMIRNLKTTMD